MFVLGAPYNEYLETTVSLSEHQGYGCLSPPLRLNERRLKVGKGAGEPLEKALVVYWHIARVHSGESTPVYTGWW